MAYEQAFHAVIAFCSIVFVVAGLWGFVDGELTTAFTEFTSPDDGDGVLEIIGNVFLFFFKLIAQILTVDLPIYPWMRIFLALVCDITILLFIFSNLGPGWGLLALGLGGLLGLIFG